MHNYPAPEHAMTEAVDPGRRFVKVTGINHRGFVEFEFSVGMQELFVELMLPPAAFEEFCLAQGVLRLDETSQTLTTRSKQ